MPQSKRNCLPTGNRRCKFLLAFGLISMYLSKTISECSIIGKLTRDPVNFDSSPCLHKYGTGVRGTTLMVTVNSEFANQARIMHFDIGDPKNICWFSAMDFITIASTDFITGDRRDRDDGEIFWLGRPAGGKKLDDNDQIRFSTILDFESRSEAKLAQNGQNVLSQLLHEDITDFAVDWINRNIYMVLKESRIAVARLECGASSADMCVKRLFNSTDEHSIKKLVVDPLTGLIFWLEIKSLNVRILRGSMDGSSKHVIVDYIANEQGGNGPYFASWLSLDLKERRIYRNSFCELISYSYSGDEEDHHTMGGLNICKDGIKSFDIHNNVFYISLKRPPGDSACEALYSYHNGSKTTNTIMHFKGAPDHTEDVTVKVFSPEKQPWSHAGAEQCQSKKCPHLCLPGNGNNGSDLSNFYVSCHCPNGVICGYISMGWKKLVLGIGVVFGITLVSLLALLVYKVHKTK